jgi:hypothetical protein
VKKLKEHVYVKILNLNQPTTPSDTNNNSSQFGAGNGTSQQKSTSSATDKSANQILELANKTIELICSDQVRFK